MRSLAEDGYELDHRRRLRLRRATWSTIAADFPDIKFAIVDGVVEQPTTSPALVFAEEQGSFLVGAAAALKTETDKIGFIGGVETELIQKFEAGFVAGAKDGEPDVEVEVKYLTPDGDFTGFDDPAKGKTIADGHVRRTAPTSCTTPPAVRARRVRGRGRGRPAWPSASTPTSTSGRRRRPAEVHPHLDAQAGRRRRVRRPSRRSSTATLEGGVGRRSTSSNGGIDYATDRRPVRRRRTQIDEFKQQIIDGEIEVPTDALSEHRRRSTAEPGSVPGPRAPTATAERHRVGAQRPSAVPAVELTGIVKRFPGVVANRDVNLRGAHAARSTPSSARTAPASRR